MKRYTTVLSLVAAITTLFCGACVAILAFYSHAFWWAPLAVWAFLVLFVWILLFNIRKILTGLLSLIAKRVDPKKRESLDAFPMPVLMLDERGCVRFTNSRFNQQVNGGIAPILGSSAETLFDAFSVTELGLNETIDLNKSERKYTAYIAPLRLDKGNGYLLYLRDDTDLKNDAAEYAASRPVMLHICVDNLEEATEHLRSGDRSRIGSAIEIMLEDWVATFSGFLQKYNDDRYVAMVEHRHLQMMRNERFSILDNVRKAFPETDGSITLSIGIGEEKRFDDCRLAAVRALDMALSRGGDQVAIKTLDGYDFFGGHSGGVEQRSRVRTRIIAEALKEIILSSDQVFVMGHRMSDLDCIGGGVAMATVARSLNVPAAMVVNSSATMAKQLIGRFDPSLFIDPASACKNINRKSLLIIVDTHSENMLESAELLKLAHRVVLIDHHRRKVDYIEDTVLTYHEPSSSSVCELITELLPYLSQTKISKTIADALLSGIMLDTRNFVLRTGVRTFEAAAYLRGHGADTVAVKKMFSEDLELYRRKSDLVSVAELYKKTAIAVSEEDYSDHRAAAAQAADDLLLVQGVVATFVLTPMEDYIQISARSYGECNVQLIMEKLGGGGHLTMAATQLKETTVAQAYEQLTAAIDNYFKDEVQ